MKRRLFAVLTLLILLVSFLPVSALGAGTEKDSCPPHKWGKWNIVEKATCTSKGTRWRVCEKCKRRDVQEYGPLSHQWKVIEEVSGTCQEKGHVKERCTRCKITRTRETEYGDHVWGEWFEPKDRIGVRERDCSVCGLQELEYFPVLSLKLEEKSTPNDGRDYYEEGETVSLYATLTNIGEGNAVNPVIFFEGGQSACAPVLSCGQSDGGSFEHKITPEEAASEKGSVTFQASAICEGSAEVFSNFVTVLTGKAKGPDLSIEKKVDVNPENGNYFVKGETIYFKVTVTNNGKEPVTNLVITDSVENGEEFVLGTESELRGEEYWSKSYGYTVTQDDVDRGIVTNTAYVTADGMTGRISDAARAECGEGETLFEVNKYPISSPDNTIFYTENEIVRYEIEIVNTGETELTDVVVTDPKISSEPVAVIAGPIAPNENALCHVDYVVTYDDCQKGEATNIAYAAVDGMVPPVPSEEAKVPCGFNEYDLLVIKEIRSEPENHIYYKEGEEILYRVTVVNKSTCKVSGVKVYDPLSGSTPIGKASGPFDPDLTVGYWEYKHKVTKDDVANIWIVNTAYATVNESGKIFYSNQKDAMCGEDPVTKISVVKSVQGSAPNGKGYYEENDVVHFLITVTNTGKLTKLSGTVYDVLQTANGGQIGTFSNLGPNESADFPFDYIITEPSDVTNGHVTNYATVWYFDDIGNFKKAVSNTVTVDTDGIPDDPEDPELTPSEGQSCEVVYDADGQPTLHYCAEHEQVHDWTARLDDPAQVRAMWQEALNAEYDKYFEAANGPAKVTVLAESMRFASFVTAREQALRTVFPDDPAKVDALIAEILEQKVVLMCYEIHNAPDERTGFAPEVTGSAQSVLMEKMNERYAGFSEYAFRSDASFFTSWMRSREEILSILYPGDGIAVQKALEQELLDNTRRLDAIR